MKTKKRKNLGPLQILLIAAAVLVYGFIALAILNSGDAWNSVGTLGAIFLLPLAAVIPLIFVGFWVFTLIEAFRRNDIIWAVFILFLPAVSLLYWLVVLLPSRK